MLPLSSYLRILSFCLKSWRGVGGLDTFAAKLPNIPSWGVGCHRGVSTWTSVVKWMSRENLSFQCPNWVWVCSNLVKLACAIKWTLRFYSFFFSEHHGYLFAAPLLPTVVGVVRDTSPVTVRSNRFSRCRSLWGGNWPSFSSKLHLGWPHCPLSNRFHPQFLPHRLSFFFFE